MAKKKSDQEKLEEDCQILANFINASVYLVGPSTRKTTSNMNLVAGESYFPEEGKAIYFAAWPKSE